MKLIRLLCLTLLIMHVSQAQEVFRNGSFFVQYNDIPLDSSNFNVHRIFNSFRGLASIYGRGWGSNLATRMWLLPDGQMMLVLDGASGERELYYTTRLNQAGVYQMIDSIIADEIARGGLQRTPTSLVRRRSELITDATNRAFLYIRLYLNRRLNCTSYGAPSMEKWYNQYRVSETVTWENDRYHLVRYEEDIYFDRCGRMIRWKDGKDSLEFHYNADGQLSVFNHGRDTSWVTMDEKDRISSISKKNKFGILRTSRYTYDSIGQLVQSMGLDSVIYRYEYDPKQNLTYIRRGDGTYWHMVYDPATTKVIGYRQPSGDSSHHEYGFMNHPDGRLNNDYYYTRTVYYDAKGRRTFGSYYENESRYKSNGESYRYQLYGKTDTNEYRYIYPPNVGNIIYGKRNHREAWQDFDQKSRPIYLRFGDSVYTCRYNVSGLPERFQAIDSVRSDTLLYEYSYNNQGTLSKVIRNQTEFIIQGSVDSGQIDVTQGNRTWTIGYAKAQPIFFKDPELGQLLIDDLNNPTNLNAKHKYLDLLPLVLPKKIEHEWIWSRF